MFEASEYWITVVEMPSFDNDVKTHLTPEKLDGLIAFLARHPDEGAIIPDTDGLRKIIWGGRGDGNDSGAQIVYYFRDLNMPLYLIASIRRGERLRLTKAEKAKMRMLVSEIVDSQWSNQVSPLVRQAAANPIN